MQFKTLPREPPCALTQSDRAYQKYNLSTKLHNLVRFKVVLTGVQIHPGPTIVSRKVYVLYNVN